MKPISKSDVGTLVVALSDQGIHSPHINATEGTVVALSEDGSLVKVLPTSPWYWWLNPELFQTRWYSVDSVHRVIEVVPRDVIAWDGCAKKENGEVTRTWGEWRDMTVTARTENGLAVKTGDAWRLPELVKEIA